ncbi:MAG: peptide-methionine (S)-S-oxide reductase MsrA [Flavobacteriaceae bacterium]|nr:peptide-methionine (S)-S-oxide reductase MsrA [Flavobacteriaceae bacterium]
MKKKQYVFPLLFLSLLSITCTGKNTTENKSKHIESSFLAEEKPNSKQQKSDEAVAYFAAGCFWCVEAIFEHVKGVRDAVSGYAGGEKPNPTYREVGRGLTKHAEAVAVYYNPKEVDFATLVSVFFGSHDPTTKNRQGPDRGAQYRSIAFYSNPTEKAIIESQIEALLDAKIFVRITTEVIPFENFYKAEAYHQNYEKRNPNNPYVKQVSIPRLNRFKKRFPELLKKN